MVECSKMISYFPMFLFAFPIPGSQIADPDPQHCTACQYRLAQKPLNYYINMERCPTIKLESYDPARNLRIHGFIQVL